MQESIVTHDEGSAHRREVVIDGQAVSRLWVLERRIRLLGTEVSMAGIGGVRTEPEHRGKRYARRLLEDTVRYMTDGGYEVSMLFGITDFYDKFGFLPALPEHVTTVAVEDARRTAEPTDGYVLRQLREDDYPFVVELHNETNRLRGGSVVRDVRRFQGFERGTDWDQPVEAVTVEDSSGRPAAYAVQDQDAESPKVTELNCADRGVFAVLLDEFARRAAQRSAEEIEFHLPADHDFCTFLRRCGCHTQLRFNRMGGGMMRVLNQTALLRNLAPAMEERLCAAPAALRDLELCFQTDLGTTELGLTAEAAPEPTRLTVRTTQDRLMQLLVGCLPAEEVLEEKRADATEKAVVVLDTIFGGQMPYVDYADRF